MTPPAPPKTLPSQGEWTRNWSIGVLRTRKWFWPGIHTAHVFQHLIKCLTLILVVRFHHSPSQVLKSVMDKLPWFNGACVRILPVRCVSFGMWCKVPNPWMPGVIKFLKTSIYLLIDHGGGENKSGFLIKNAPCGASRKQKFLFLNALTVDQFRQIRTQHWSERRHRKRPQYQSVLLWMNCPLRSSFEPHWSTK